MRIVSILGVLFLFAETLFSKDIIVTKSGRVVECEVTKQDSANCYFTFRNNGERTSTFLKNELISEINFNVKEQRNDTINDSMFRPGTKMLGLNGFLTKPNSGLMYINATTNLNYFLVSGLFIGGNLSYTNQSQKGFYNYAIGIGPSIGYMVNGGSVFPYIQGTALISYNKSNIASFSWQGVDITGSSASMIGCDVGFGAGVLIPFNKNVCFVGELQYHYISMKPKESESTSKRVMAIALGVNVIIP